MIRKNTDARAIRTRTQLKTTLINELANRPLHEITVSSLCRIIQINRVTFYDHYKDIFDLAAAIEQDLLEELQDTFQRLSLEEASSYLVSDSMFEFLDSHRKVMLLLLKSETSISFRKKIHEAIFPFFEAQLEYRYGISKDVKQEDIQNIMHYVTSGYEYFYTRYLEDPSLDYHAISTLCTDLSTELFLSRIKMK